MTSFIYVRHYFTWNPGSCVSMKSLDLRSTKAGTALSVCCYIFQCQVEPIFILHQQCCATSSAKTNIKSGVDLVFRMVSKLIYGPCRAGTMVVNLSGFRIGSPRSRSGIAQSHLWPDMGLGVIARIGGGIGINTPSLDALSWTRDQRRWEWSVDI